MKRDLYEILEVSRSASDDEIRKSYKRLAKKYHPDLNPGDKTAEERFKEVAVAYEVIHDPARRKSYDEFGETALNPNFDPDRAREYARWQHAGPGAPPGAGSSPFGGVDFSDLFADFFGRGRGGANAWSRARQIHGQDIESSLRINLIDALRGSKVNFRLTGSEGCADCKGTGAQPGQTKVCPICDGSGQQRMSGPFSVTTRCSACGGTGRSPGPPCPTCGGRGSVSTESVVTVNVPAGIKDGAKIRLAGKGEPGLGGAPPGDLFLKVEITPHPRLTRDGDDLVMTLPVSVPEAVLGASITVPLINGEVNVKVPPRSQTGQKLRLRSKGAPKGRGKGSGDMILVLEVQTPTSNSKELDQLAESLKKFYPQNVRADLKL
jgi:molecular chaperone DnaJ